MTEKKETTHVLVPHSLVLFIRPRSSVWQCRYQVDGIWQRESTQERDLDKAKAVAHDLLVEANVRKKLKAAPITRAFKDIAKQAILRMEKQIEDGDGKVMYKEYISIIEKYLIKFFGKYKVDAITHPLIEEFEEWRVMKMGITPKRSTTLNHNAALNRVFDEAIYRGYMYEINRPKLVAIGKKSERRPAFSIEEVRALRGNFDSWIEKARTDSVALRSLLRDYVTILLDTGKAESEWAPLIGRFIVDFVMIEDSMLHIIESNKRKLTEKEIKDLEKFNVRVKCLKKIMKSYLKNENDLKKFNQVMDKIKKLYDIRNLLAHNSLVFAYEQQPNNKMKVVGFQINGKKKDISLNFTELKKKSKELISERKKFAELSMSYYEAEFELIKQATNAQSKLSYEWC